MTEILYALLAIAPEVYVRRLLGVEVPRHRKVPCPFHPDRHASLHVYDTAQRGWYCFGYYGSGGDALFVSSQPIDATNVFSTQNRFAGPAIGGATRAMISMSFLAAAAFRAACAVGASTGF